MTDPLYRSGIGLMIRNRDKLVFMGERLDNPGHFQMPQGGIDDGENLQSAVFRELYEETGIRNAVIIAEMAVWLHYDFPDDWRQRLFDGRYKGQRQKWFLLDFTGEDSEIDLNAHEEQEFRSYQWTPAQTVPALAIDFKQDTYKRVLADFLPHF